MAKSPTARSRTYREFWARYLDEHRLAAPRGLHIAGTCLGLFLLPGAAAAARRRPSPMSGP